MKPQNIIISIILLLVLVFSACREITVTTKVNRDGTFTRIITVTGDSGEVNYTSLPFPIDGSWQKSFSKDTLGEDKYVTTYTKTYRTSDELNAEMANDTSWHKQIKREITVKKRFGFFYSYLRFSEIYKSVSPFSHVDYRDYLTGEDLDWITGTRIPVTPADSVMKQSVDDKMDQFFEKAAFDEVEAIMRDGILKLNDPSLSPESISAYHDSLSVKINSPDIKDGNQIIDFYREWSGNEAFGQLKKLEPPIFNDFMQKFEDLDLYIQLEGYTNEVEMPGLITATNSSALNGNLARWALEPTSFILTDCEMYVESRVINYWAFALAGAVVLLLLVLLAVKAFR
jgi:hypothetical protein